MAPAARNDDSTPDDATVLALRKALVDESEPLARRFRALFSLKHLACQTPATGPQTLQAIDAIAAGFSSASALLKHELAYCLGQSRNAHSLSYLRSVLEDKYQDAMCRHEAAEALGALGYKESLELLCHLRDDLAEPEVIRETCDIAVARIEWEHSAERRAERLKQSNFASVDPAPPMPQEEQPSTKELERAYLDVELPLFKRYRAMFALRDLASPRDLPTAASAVECLAKGLHDPSALFRHEVAFVFGQLCHPASIPALIECLSDTSEAGMVRHEAAEALGSLGDEEGVEDILRQFVDDPEQVVRDSVIVALDMAEYERSGQVEYATVPGMNDVTVA